MKLQYNITFLLYKFFLSCFIYIYIFFLLYSERIGCGLITNVTESECYIHKVLPKSLDISLEGGLAEH
jgi:hypothetical protein